MPYTQVKFSELVDSFALRLADSGKVFYLQTELEAYLLEALRTWQAMSAFLTINVPVTVTPNAILYDLLDQIPEISSTVTDHDILKDICRHLQEPLSTTIWNGSDQYSYDQIVAAIQKRLDKFMLETGIRLTVTEVDGPGVGGNSIVLDDHVIDVRRAMWKTVDNTYSILWKAGPHQLAANNPGWTMAAANQPPTDYTLGLLMPLGMWITPQPTEAGGKIALLTVNSRPTLNPANGATILGIPDDLAWVIKFGALADIFAADGPGEDLARSAYCESRWQDGIRIAKVHNTIRQGFVNGQATFIDDISELDQSNPNWVSDLAGAPQFLSSAANILAISPIADNSSPTITFDIAPKFPVPALADYVQIGKEHLDVILDYAEHLSTLKEGAEEVKGTMQLYHNLVANAVVQNERLRSIVRDLDVLTDRTLRERRTNLRQVSDVAAAEAQEE